MLDLDIIYSISVSFVIISWLIYIYGVFIKKIKKSTVYGILSISYILHSLSCRMLEIPYGLFFFFSIVFLFFYSLNRYSENISMEGDINKKEK